MQNDKGSREYVAVAGKCWPAFQTQFGFVPCYVNSRLTGRGIPVSCEVDIYGALSEFIGTVVSEDAVTLLDINNTVPKDLYKADIEGKYPYALTDTFMGFHCGNTCSKKLCFCEMKYQLIMARSLPEEVTQGTLEGDIAAGDITFFAFYSGGNVEQMTRIFATSGLFRPDKPASYYEYTAIKAAKDTPHYTPPKASNSAPKVASSGNSKA